MMRQNIGEQMIFGPLLILYNISLAGSWQDKRKHKIGKELCVCFFGSPGRATVGEEAYVTRLTI